MICRRSPTSPPAARRARSAMSSGCKQEFPNAQPALGYGLTETNAVGCANFWGNYAAKPASTGRAAEAARRGRDPRRRTTRICRPARRGEIAIRTAANIRCYWRNAGSDRGAVHAPTATSAPATSAISTRTAICSSSTARRTSSSAAARISPRPRSRRHATPARRSPRSRVFGAPDERLGEVPVAVVHCRNGSDSTKRASRSSSTAALAKFKIPARFIFSDEPLPRLGTGKIDRRALKAQVRALNARPPDIADRRRRGHRPDRRFRAVAAPSRQRPRHAARGEQAFGNFIKVARDGRITVAVPQAETGQGIWTALPQIVADELGAAWETVAVEPAPLTDGLCQSARGETGWLDGSAGCARTNRERRRRGSPPARPRCARSSSRCARPRRWRGRCWSAPPPTAGTSIPASATPPTAS